jgi:hypothetical protein
MHSLHPMTAFLAYILPSSTLSLLTDLQAEIPGQDQYQYGYDAEPDFFRGMHGVCASVSFESLTHIVHYSILKFLDRDLSSALGASRNSSSL